MASASEEVTTTSEHAGKTKVAIIGNCQARSLASLICALAPAIEVTAVTVTHLAKDSERESAYKLYAAAEFILAQAVQDNYPIAHITTANLQKEFGAKLLTWPNLFFKGQGPDICYLTMPGKGRVLGPLGEYQHLPTYRAWRNGMSTAATVNRLADGDEWLAEIHDIPQKSIDELKARERGLDVKFAGYIESRWRHERLFFTFNHPVKHLLLGVAKWMLNRLGIAFQPSPAVAGIREPLDRIIPALLPALASQLGLELEPSMITKGCAVKLEKTVVVEKKVVNYDLQEFVELSFRCLDLQVKPAMALRIT